MLLEREVLSGFFTVLDNKSSHFIQGNIYRMLTKHSVLKLS